MKGAKKGYFEIPIPRHNKTTPMSPHICRQPSVRNLSGNLPFFSCKLPVVPSCAPRKHCLGFQ